MTSSSFNEKQVLHKLKHLLPAQAPIKDFIHHNPLHSFQNLKFYDAIFKANNILGYNVTLQLSEYRELYKIGRIGNEIFEKIIIERKGIKELEKWKENLLTKEYNAHITPRIGSLRLNWKEKYKIDLDSLVQPLLFRVLCAYLDQGISIWNFPVKNDGFLASIKELEKNSFSSFFKTNRAKDLLLNGSCELKDLLKIVLNNESLYEQYLFDQQFSHQGWSGIVSAIEDQPGTLMDKKSISLRELIVLELILEIDALDFELDKNWLPLGNIIKNEPTDLFAESPATELNEVFMIWQDAFEWTYYEHVLHGITSNKKRNLSALKSPSLNGREHSVAAKSFQAVFCLDERECSFRRHIENTDHHCETLGAPGFFAVEFYFQPENGNFYDKLCPAPVTPKYLIKEIKLKHKRKHDFLYTKQTHTLPGGFFLTLSFGFLSAIRLFLNLFSPKMSPAISNAFAHIYKDSELVIENKNISDRENNLQLGFTVTEMADRVEALLRSIGLVKEFAPLVYIVAHGSSSANNPHHAAHDCGACSGRPGSVNARVFSFMANHPQVREILNSRNLVIPVETQFVGSLHDTASDEMEFYDEHILSSKNLEGHKINSSSFEKALGLNAKERSRRFASINTKMNLKKVREAVRKRSASLFEPRPELGHGTNSLCVIGGRNITKGLFLDRRAFLNSYNYKTDPDGKLLSGVMKPIGIVCGGINLEYYFSRVDNYRIGAGTKLPHHVMGLIGVSNSVDGDLRPGLPLQMIEVHDPVRLLVIVEHFPEVVLKTISEVPEMYEWYINDWVHLMVIHPDTNEFHYFKNGAFTKYVPLLNKTESLTDIISLMESSKKMETNQAKDATQENLPVYILN